MFSCFQFNSVNYHIFYFQVVDHLIPQKTPDLTGVFSAKDESEMTTFLRLLGPLLEFSSMLPQRKPEGIDERDQFLQGCQKMTYYSKTDRQKPLHMQSNIQEGDEEDSQINSED